MIHIHPDLKRQLKRAAEKSTDNERVAGYGPGGGNPHAKVEDTLYWQALKAIEALEKAQHASLNRENPHVWYRHGIILFTEEFLMTLNHETRKAIFGEMIPLGMSFDETSHTYTLKAASWQFRETVGDELPEYQVLVHINPDGTYKIDWKERT